MQTRKAWQRLACSPRGISVSPPSNSSETKLSTHRPTKLLIAAVSPPAGVPKISTLLINVRVHADDPSKLHRVTAPNFMNFINNVEKSLPLNILKLEFDIPIRFEMTGR